MHHHETTDTGTQCSLLSASTSEGSESEYSQIDTPPLHSHLRLSKGWQLINVCRHCYCIVFTIILSSDYRDEMQPSSSLPPDPNQCYIVFESMLMLLFAVCKYCGSHEVNLMKTIIGSFLHLQQLCSKCGRRWVWDSQPLIRKIPAGNICLSAAILYASTLPTKGICVLTFLKCQTISTDTFFVTKGNIFNHQLLQFMKENKWLCS